jgi:predicted RNA binding protein YcfA (HicA-like mRNA interferase family)
MGLLSPVKTKKYRKFLKYMGWRFNRIKGDHEIWTKNNRDDEIVFITNDKEVQPFIIRQNNKTLEISDKEFLRIIRKL